MTDDDGRPSDDQASAAQDPTAQAPYGQAPYGQAPYGQAPYGQPPYGETPYGQAPYGQAPSGHAPYAQPPSGAVPYGYGGAVAYGPPQYEHPQGTTVLILGILGIVACQALAPFAWVMGNRTLAEIDANPAAYSNRGHVVAGRICGIVGSALLALSVVLFVPYLLFVVVVFGGSAG